jgi:hypothetical protein
MKLLTTCNAFEAEIIKSKLDSYGMDCFIQRDDIGGTSPSLSFVEGVRVYVNESDFDRACQIIPQAKNARKAASS